MATSPNMNAAAIALNRFGLGARADDTPPADPKGWLLAQFEQYQSRPAAWASQPDSVALSGELAQQRMQLNQLNRQTQQNANEGAAASQTNAQTNPQTNPQTTGQSASETAAQTAKQAERKALRGEILDMYRSSVNARVASALTTETPFIERLVHFWANHFAVSTEKPAVAALAGSFEAEAIRPHVLGRFEDMLVAVERHPAMQLFLDQTRSVGPDSMAAMRAAERNPNVKRGLNENLAREIMELHTLGVRSGYSQDDVTEFARALTGWSLAGNPGNPGNPRGQGLQTNAAPGTFVFRVALHEPGSRTIMGRRYDQPGEKQALAILHDLASAPATAQHIGGKLARHFVADNPPPDVSERLANAFARSGGDLPTVYRTLLDMPQAWSPAAVKFKTPWEWTISSMRGLGWQDIGNMQAAPVLTQLGQPVWRPGSPAGYDDIAASWAAPDALVRRVEVAQRFASRVGDRLDARSLGQTLLAGSLSAPTTTAVSRAESASTAIALLLVSPDFQRR
ncbi:MULTISPECIES: DUF1800 family protein [Paraburkholderia]|uniref:DUF1800 domain-containing protein n=1 Tax=Paraburkholderia madseniana TaxID=2599607 RepID=A0AAP5EPU3_9BURK|nr:MULTISPECIES: DUF1800 family protein [Paraburkholderia]MCX4148047.1 DUF1800 family protein [Paraburkholderia madseniana]MDN7150986.1 DUF1800 domain-containing protein [Paraburkholderia sp. WS6]MDQ6409866.1 DUF1800 domain-containing protein [Paraburkholderia madseniana]